MAHLKFLIAFTFLAQLGLAINTAYPFDVTEIRSPDGSITAKYISLGATMTEFWVKDKTGVPRDIMIGYDDNTKLLTDPLHPYFGPVVGRYANRIKNGTFSIPITKNAQPPGPNVFQIPKNDQNGQVALHGGTIGYDRHNWTISARTPSSVTYKHIDNADEGFPGVVTVFATYSVSNGGVYEVTFRATATKKTPIMLSQHVYWNLDAFVGGSTNVLNHNLQMSASRVVQVDSLLIPTGKFINVPNTPFDFRKTQKVGSRFNQTIGNCGVGCTGYDNCWVYDKPTPGLNRAQASLSSDVTGIRLDMFTDQSAIQIYTGSALNEPRKVVHGGPTLRYGQFSAMVIEQEGLIDAINTPEWGVDQIYGPDRPYSWKSIYKFSTKK